MINYELSELCLQYNAEQKQLKELYKKYLELENDLKEEFVGASKTVESPSMKEYYNLLMEERSINSKLDEIEEKIHELVPDFITRKMMRDNNELL